MADYFIGPERANLHGHLSNKIPPALRIRSGDTVTFSTLEGDWRLERPAKPESSSGLFFPRKLPEDCGHALCGPIYIEGARPGMTLAAHLEKIVPSDWGWSRVGDGDLGHLSRIECQEGEYFLIWDLDKKRGTCRSHRGHQVAMSPFMGVLAVAPDSVEPVSTHPPGLHGANLDCRELIEGSTLYLPIFTEGALFSVGDGHAAQGDGESGCTAIECPMKEVRIRLEIQEGSFGSPVADTPGGWVAFGFSESLTDASYNALGNMALLMERLYGYEYREALSMCSVAVNLRITQIVNGIRGVHAILPKGSIFQ